MKKLIIVRHAKSSWDFENISDFDRPLKLSGIQHAHLMAGRLKSKGIRPDLIISSPAARSLQTAVIFATDLGVDMSLVRIEKDFYESYVDKVMQILNALNDEVKTVLVFGHNPCWTNLANYLMDSYIDNIPTTGVLGIDVNTDTWADLAKNKQHLEFFDYPKKLVLPDAPKI